ncbi:uncharacterized protein LOC142344036 [Convolutriloba macropyga]|uniref:uncharacterized protein LOC142344036 n=1 Tax=Convolutriloba macropyga TaxID=536237 RepID=UPI003F527135
MVEEVRYATAFSDFVLVCCCFYAIYNVSSASWFASISFTVIALAASLGVLRFSTGGYKMYHEKLSNIGASLAMPLILTAVLRHFSLPEIYQAVLVVVAMVLSIRGKRSEGEMLAGFCILCLIGISVAYRHQLLGCACALYVISAVILNFKTVMGVVSTTDIFHYLISIAIILFSFVLNETL